MNKFTVVPCLLPDVMTVVNTMDGFTPRYGGRLQGCPATDGGAAWKSSEPATGCGRRASPRTGE